MIPAEAKHIFDVCIRVDYIQRPVQEALSAEIVIVVAEGLHSIFICKRMLTKQRLRVQKIIISQQFVGDMRLVMPVKERNGRAHIVPFSKAGAINNLILRDHMVLRKVEGNNFHGEFPRL